MALSKYSRSPSSPSPIYGIRPGMTVGDFDRSYTPTIGVLGTFDATSGYLTSQATTTQTSANIDTKCRVAKIAVNVTGTGSIVLVVKSAVDSYATTIATYSSLTAGNYEFFLGGYGSPGITQGGPNNSLYPSSDGSSYAATQYGPVKPGSSPSTTNPTGDEEETNPDPAADSNYVGGTYNPFQYLSLDGYALQFTATVTGTVGYDVEVAPVS